MTANTESVSKRKPKLKLTRLKKTSLLLAWLKKMELPLAAVKRLLLEIKLREEQPGELL